MMKDKGVLNCRRDGTSVYYHIESKHVIKLLHCMNDRHKRKSRENTESSKNKKGAV